MKYLSSLAVANWFLLENPDSTVIKLQRLTYFSHCWCLALYNEPLVDEFVVAHTWGPVFLGIYNTAKEYGSGPVKDPLSEYPEQPPTIDPKDPRISLLLKIQEIYGSYSNVQLCKLANEKDGPWHITRTNQPDRKNPYINENLIISYFRSKIQNDDQTTNN